MTFRMIEQLWNTNTPAFVSCDADQTENYMYISMKFGTGVHVFCWEVGVFNRSPFQSVSCKISPSSSKRSVMITLEMCPIRAEISTQTFGKMYLFVICMINRHWFQTKLLLYIGDFGQKYHFYAPGLKGPPGASSNRIVRLFVIPSRLQIKCNI